MGFTCILLSNTFLVGCYWDFNFADVNYNMVQMLVKRSKSWLSIVFVQNCFVRVMKLGSFCCKLTVPNDIILSSLGLKAFCDNSVGLI